MKDLSRRYYNEANKEQDNSKHVLSNQEVLYEFIGFDICGARALDGANLFDGFLCSKELDGICFETYSRRVPGKNSWEYTIVKKGKVCGTCYDYITSNGSLIREFDMATPLKFKIHLSKNSKQYLPGIYYAPKGCFYVNDYPTAEDVYFRFDGGNTSICIYDDDIVFFVEKKARIIITINKDINKLNETNFDEYNFEGFSPFNEQIKDIEEDVFYVFKSLTTKKGAILSALPWNLAYIRDNYGACLGLLQMHRYDDVKKLLLYFKNGFLEQNKIATAISLGNDKSLHIHENDYSENTGYIILLSFKYFELTHDEELLKEMMPLLLLAYRGAKELLVDGMMPFSGDETYIACNLIPRVCVDEGSAESTLLFIESTKKILNYLEINEKEEAIKLINEATSSYKEHFVKDGKIMANNPSRRIKANLKETRKGVCPYCYSYDYYFLNKYKLYACKNCFDKSVDISNDKQYYLTCVSLMPLYIESDLFSKEELIDIYEDFAKKLISIYFEGKEFKTKIAGYEYGLLLHGLIKLNSKYMHEIYKICILARDQEKIWSEYYIDKKNCGMRWRTWEPGVNMMAIEEYLEYIKNETN